MIAALFQELLERHGPQGWWPLFDPTAGEPVYRPGDYAPIPPDRRAEVAIGAILTQNTNWANASLALVRLASVNALNWETLTQLPAQQIETLIRPARYYRQKAIKLQKAAAFFLETGARPDRSQLLRVWGIGPETADSILLYAFAEPVVVVDAYLRRVLHAAGLAAQADLPYERLRHWVETQMPREHAVLGEFHALIVAEGKQTGP